jgi:hypothetical protein
MRKTGSALVCGTLLFALAVISHASVTPDIQKMIRQDTFEVVMKKPDKDLLSYEKPLPLDLLPFIERTDAYRSIGTAFALGHNNFVTAAHVFSAGVGSQFGPPALRGADGTVYDVDRIIKFSLHEDYVVFSLRNDPAPPGFAVNQTPSIDEPVLAIGNALGEGIVIRDGLYTSETPEDQDGRWKWIRFSAAASPGNSGGPLCDAKGQVIGIVIGKSANENLNYSMPISRVIAGDSNKAHFDQRALVKLPYLHGSITYVLKDEFSLPLLWRDFVNAYQRVIEKGADESQTRLLEAYKATAFPHGTGTEDIFFNPQSNNVWPRLISQRDDGAWVSDNLDYHTVNLPGDGLVAAAAVGNERLLRLVRPNTASDDAFYSDSKAFMDLALQAIDFERTVGPDRIRVTSLGRAMSDDIYGDSFGRKWQERVWAVPFQDAYLIGLLLPTPDGYDALIGYAPSATLYASKKEARLMASQINLSYTGTLEQWSAMLRRKTLLPEALQRVSLSKSPDWTLATSRFASRVPAEVLSLTPASPLSLTMGFVHDADRTSWEVQEIWWSKNNRYDDGIGIWRRSQPSASAKLELRNQFDSLITRRAPYDGTFDRESNEIYSTTKVLDVRGTKPGTVSSDLVYGVTLRTGSPSEQAHALDSLQAVARATDVLEVGNGLGAPPTAVKDSPTQLASSTAPGKRELFMQGVQRYVDGFGANSVDIRGRFLKDDVKQFTADVDAKLAPIVAANDGKAVDVELTAQFERFKILMAYWDESKKISHSHEMWSEFLLRNHLPSTRPHDPDVIAAEQALLQEVRANALSADWAAKERALLGAYIRERVRIAATLPHDVDPSRFAPRSIPCPAPAANDSGNDKPKAIGSSKSAEDYWPMESKRLGEEGNVVTGIKISETGCIVGKEIIISSGSDMLDNA